VAIILHRARERFFAGNIGMFIAVRAAASDGLRERRTTARQSVIVTRSLHDEIL